ncbi:hypothetical protein ABVT39_006268 [Epinephelus coioides]
MLLTLRASHPAPPLRLRPRLRPPCCGETVDSAQSSAAADLSSSQSAAAAEEQSNDTFRIKHPQSRQYTWVRVHNNTVCAARLDRLYLSKTLSPKLVQCTISPVGFTDHHFINIELILSPVNTTPLQTRVTYPGRQQHFGCAVFLLPVSTGNRSTTMDNVDGHDWSSSDTPDENNPDSHDESGLDGPDGTGCAETNQSDPCGPAVDIDCSVDLPDSRPAVSTLPVDLLPSDAGFVVASEAGQSFSSDNLQTIRTRIIVHVGINDSSLRHSEVTKSQFRQLLQFLTSTGKSIFISGPLSPHGCGIEEFSRVLQLHTWLQSVCRALSVGFIDHFNLFWNHQSLLKPDGIHPNRLSSYMLKANLQHAVHSYPPD